MKPVNIEQLVIGDGTPKICVSIMAKEIEEAVLQSKKLKASATHLVEVRGDYLEPYAEPEYITQVISEVRRYSQRPVIYTFRTGNEGGEKSISKEQYTDLLCEVIRKRAMDLIDIELFTGDEEIKKLTELAHQNDVKVIMSNHNFEMTPDETDIVSRLKKMEAQGADIAKIAVMPQQQYDVNRLLNATSMAYQEMEIPIVTMSMGRLGAVSRIIGEVFGSSITFGAFGAASAPGQIEVKAVEEMLELVHRHCCQAG